MKTKQILVSLSVSVLAMSIPFFQAPAKAFFPIEIPDIALPSVEIPEIELPSVDIPGTDLCIGFDCPGSPIFGSDWLKDRWDELGEGPASAARICNAVGVDVCSDANFMHTYQILRAGQWNDVFYDANSCAATGYTLSDYGHSGAQLVGIAYGAVIPAEFLDLSKEMYTSHINASCNYLFAGSVNTNDIVRVRTDDGDAVYVPERDAEDAKSRIQDY